MRVEEEHEDILQNIEFAIISVYREEPELLDYDVDKVLDRLRRAYGQGEVDPPPPQYTERQKKVYERVTQMCDWRLGRSDWTGPDGAELRPEPVAPDVIVACLKRLQKSVQLWTQQGGRQGYLNFVSDFIH